MSLQVSTTFGVVSYSAHDFGSTKLYM